MIKLQQIPELANARLSPFQHQIEGVWKLIQFKEVELGRTIAGPYGLFDEMGNGKTKQTIDGAQVLYMRQLLRRVIVVAPASVRSVWFDQELGELAKHLWHNVPCRITEYHAKSRTWTWAWDKRHPQHPDWVLEWVITNYDFIRQLKRIKYLQQFCDPSTMIVGDESSALKNWSAKQTKAFFELRKKCGRCVLLNGTPITQTPLDMYAQGRIMHPKILDVGSYYHMRAKYSIVTTRGGFPKITGYQNLDDLQKRFKPYVLRRLKSECLDLPPNLPPVYIKARMSNESWHAYKEMRDELVIWLTENKVASAALAITKMLRLSQITSGFVGGVETTEVAATDDEPEFIRDLPFTATVVAERQLVETQRGPIQYVGREKIDTYLEWLEQVLYEDPVCKVLTWCRFRPEITRYAEEIQKNFQHVAVEFIVGGQKKDERDRALRLLDPRTSPKDRAGVVFGTQASGGMGLTLTAAHTVMETSFDYSVFKHLQAMSRTHRPGQEYPVSNYGIIAEGPQGQKTIDHTIIAARSAGVNLADWTSGAWVQALTEE